jgi:hypothetical protein
MELGFRYDANVTRNPLVFDGGFNGVGRYVHALGGLRGV